MSLHLGSSVSRDLSAVVARATDHGHGLITDLYEDVPVGDLGGLRLVHARLASPVYFRGNAPRPGRTPECGIGAGFDREGAYWAAIGEAVERYAAAIYWRDTLTWAPAAGLGERAIDLTRLVRVGRAEVVDFDPAAARYWVAGTDLATGANRLVPAAMAYLAYEARTPDEIICQDDSTGLACGRTFGDAALRAVCEILERDAFAATWLLGHRPPRIDLSARDLGRLSPGCRRVLTHRGFRMDVFHLAQSFGVHVVATVTRSAQGAGVVAAAAAPSLDRAMEKAAAEGMHAWISARKMAGQPAVETVSRIGSPADHARYYLRPERFEIVSSVFCGDTTVGCADLSTSPHVDLSASPHADLAAITHGLAEAGLGATAVDLTTGDVADLGFRVVRVVVPGLQPLVFGPACLLAPDTRRLEQWRAAWAMPAGPLNPCPHPFP